MTVEFEDVAVQLGRVFRVISGRVADAAYIIPTQDEGFSFFSGMLRLQHLLRCDLHTFGFCNLSGVRVNNER